MAAMNNCIMKLIFAAAVAQYQGLSKNTAKTMTPDEVSKNYAVQ